MRAINQGAIYYRQVRHTLGVHIHLCFVFMDTKKALSHVGGLDISFYPASPAPAPESDAPLRGGQSEDDSEAASCSLPEQGVAALVVLSYPVRAETIKQTSWPAAL